jgi:predicted nucleic-acid-binding Zn-ribbon protein
MKKIQHEEMLHVDCGSCKYAKRALRQYGTIVDKYLIKKERSDK